MSQKQLTLDEREEIELLLPWYVTGKLDPADTARVETWLEHEPSMRRQLDIIREEQDQDIRANEMLATRQLSAERTLVRTRASESSASGLLTSVAEGIRGLLTAPTSGALQWAAAAAAIVIVVQAAVIGSLSTRESARYETASGGPAQTAVGTFALVRFANAATLGDIAAVLDALGMSIVDGPRAGGLFRIRIAETQLDPTARDAGLAALRKLDRLFILVAPSN